MTRLICARITVPIEDVVIGANGEDHAGEQLAS